MTRGKQAMMRWAVVGCGQIARDKTIPALQACERASLVAVCDTRADVVGRLAKELGVPAFGSTDDLLREAAFDCAYVATPTAAHVAPVTALLNAGKHVLCEKPVAASAADVLQIHDAALRNRARVFPAYMSRYGSAFAEARERVTAGALGTLLQITAHFSYDGAGAYPKGSDGAWRWSPQPGGGPLHDVGIYLLFAIREITGERISRVCFTERNVRGLAADRADSVHGWFCTERGIPGVMTTTFTHSEMFVRFIGSRGVATLTGAFSQSAAGVLEMETEEVSLRLGSATPAGRHYEHYRRQVDTFIDAVTDPQPADLSILDAAEDALVIDAIESSVRSGRAETVNYAEADARRMRKAP